MAVVSLRRSDAASPLLVSLAVDSSVYLYSADIEPDRRASTRRISRTRTENTASWTDLITFEGEGQEVRIGVNWVAVDSVAPGRTYRATLTVRDGAGALAQTLPGSVNPIDISGRIGPASDPTDMGRIDIVIS